MSHAESWKKAKKCGPLGEEVRHKEDCDVIEVSDA